MAKQSRITLSCNNEASNDNLKEAKIKQEIVSTAHCTQYQ